MLYIHRARQIQQIYHGRLIIGVKFSTKWIICALNVRIYFCVFLVGFSIFFLCRVSAFFMLFANFCVFIWRVSCNCGDLFGNGINLGAVCDFPGFYSLIVADTSWFRTIRQRGRISFVGPNRFHWFVERV